MSKYCTGDQINSNSEGALKSKYLTNFPNHELQFLSFTDGNFAVKVINLMY